MSSTFTEMNFYLRLKVEFSTRSLLEYPCLNVFSISYYIIISIVVTIKIQSSLGTLAFLNVSMKILLADDAGFSLKAKVTSNVSIELHHATDNHIELLITRRYAYSIGIPIKIQTIFLT